MAEREGFEPSVQTSCTTDFESAAFDHSATFPSCVELCSISTDSQSVVRLRFANTD